MDMPQTNIRDYVVKCRQAGTQDAKIIETLKSSNWPQDIIEQALEDADAIFPAIPEVIEEPAANAAVQKQDAAKPTDQKIAAAKTKNPEQKSQDIPQGTQKKFSIFAFISFLLSPIPFLGMALCMTAFDYTNKKKMSGAFFAVLGILINIAVLLSIIYIIFTIFSMTPDRLTGFSKFINDQFNLV